jgi:hypothetical protein
MYKEPTSHLLKAILVLLLGVPQSEDELKKENERLRNEIRYEQIRRENELAKVEWKAERERKTSTLPV